jgi:hypothetical protein
VDPEQGMLPLTFKKLLYLGGGGGGDDEGDQHCGRQKDENDNNYKGDNVNK